MGKMSREDLFREIGEIDETYVEEARRAGRRHRPVSRASKVLAAAASLVLCVGVGYMALLVTQPHGNTGGAVDGAPGGDVNGTAMEAAREQYSMAEDTAGQTAGGGAMEEAAAQAAQEKEMGQAAVTGQEGREPAPEAVQEPAPAQAPEQASNQAAETTQEQTPGQVSEEVPVQPCEDRADSQHTDSDREQEDAENILAESTQFVSGGMDLTWEAARADAVYGQYVDVPVPEGYSFTSGIRTALDLHVIWNRGMEEIRISCRQADEDVSDWLVDVEKPEEYDLGLYTIPWCDSVPQELIQRVSNATFRPEQVTLEIVTARTYQAQETGDVSGSRTHIGILYSDNVLVEVSAKGPSAEEIYRMIHPEG